MSYNKQSGMWEGYIYVITNKVTNKVYIGQTRKTVEKRWKEHLAAAKSTDRKPVLYNSMRKYGIENFYIFTIGKYEGKTKEELINTLNEKEIFWIALLDSTYDNYGYNMLLGGNDTPGNLNQKPVYQFDTNGIFLQRYESCNDIDKSIISATYVCKICSKNTLFGNGYIWSYNEKLSQEDLIKIQEYKEKFEEKYGERFNDNIDIKSYKIKRKIYQFTLDKKFVKEWESKTSASLYYTNGKSCAALNSVFKGINHQAFGYLWSYNKEIDFKYKSKKELASKKVRQYDLSFNYIKTIESIRDAERELNVCHCDSISKVCIGECLQAFGYIWRFEGDNEDNPNLYYEKQGYMKPVKQFDLSHNYIASFENMINIESYKPTYIKWCCDGKTKKAYGYIWEYDYNDIESALN